MTIRWLILAALATAFGCRGVGGPAAFHPQNDPHHHAEKELATAPLVPIEMVANRHPAATPEMPKERLPPRGVTIEVVMTAAWDYSTGAALLDIPRHDSHCRDDLRLAIKPLLAADARNRSAMEAGLAFYQLAELEGRIELTREALTINRN